MLLIGRIKATAAAAVASPSGPWAHFESNTAKLLEANAGAGDRDGGEAGAEDAITCV